MQQIRITHPFDLLTMSLLTVSAADSTAESCKDHWYYVDYSGRQYQCFDSLQTAVNSVKDDETAEIIFRKDFTFDFKSSVKINKNVTLNLNGQTAIMDDGGIWTVEGANVTVKNGTIDTTKHTQDIVVNSKDKASTLTFDNDVTVKGALSANSVIKIDDASEKTVVNINGNWTIANEIVACNPGKDEDLTINLNATVKATNLAASNALVVLDAGKSVVNVNGGSYTSNAYVFKVTNGTLNVNAGTIKATGRLDAIYVTDPTGSYTNSLTIAGGKISSESNVYEAIWFDGTKGTYKISGGTITSGKDEEGKQLPALHINNINFLENHKNMITGGNFTGAIVGDVKEGTRITKAEKAIADLVGNATVSEKDGVVTVGGSHEENKKPSDPTEPAPNT